MRLPIKQGLEPIDVKACIETLGHDPVMEPGTVVELVYPTASVSLFDTLCPDLTLGVPVKRLPMYEAGVGIVAGRAWHVDPLELRKASLDPSALGPLPLLRGVSKVMWYWVAFKPGLFWARYDWIRSVEGPVDA